MSAANPLSSSSPGTSPPCLPPFHRCGWNGWGRLIVVLVIVLQESRVRADWLDAWLASGRVAPAIEQARRLADPIDATGALRRIAAHQRARGQLDAADRTLRFIPDPLARNRERARGVLPRPEKPSSEQPSGASGGASVADFTELIDLITSTVSPSSWEALGGVGNVRPFVSGVYVDPQGVLRNNTEQITEFPLADLLAPTGLRPPEEVAQASRVRVVSLRRLERELASRLASGLLPTAVMHNLAGLYRLEAVALRTVDHDILLVGPAAGWHHDADGRAVSNINHAPLLNLDDLVVLLQSASRDEHPGVFGCSINTRNANLARLRDFVEQSNRAGPLAPGRLRGWLNELQQCLGRQDVVIEGVPADSRVALVLVAADYRMKRIGVGQVDAGADIPDYFTLLRRARLPEGPPLEALRWWLTMGDRQIVRNSERTIFQWRGDAVWAQSENQFISAQGQRVPTGVAEPVNREFAKNLTLHFDELANRDAVFGDLRNVFDLALAATVMQTEDWWGRCEWPGGVLRQPGGYPLANLPVPREVESVVAHRVYNKRQIVVQVAGGVQVDVPALLRATREQSPSTQITRMVEQRGNRDNWWWDAAAP